MKGAGFLKRMFSLIYDTLAIIGIVLSLSLLLVLLNGGSAEENSFASFIQFLIITLSGPCFYTYFWLSNKGQTLGMQAWKIQLICKNKDLSVSICLLRCLISFISFVVLGMGYLIILYHKENKSLADLLTKTEIIDIKKT